MGSDLTRIATELYALVPDDFTAARNARAKALAGDDSRELAEHVRRLAKPSASAWAVNSLVRADPGLVAALLALRERFRQAQETGDRGELKALDRQRHESIAKAVALAQSLAGDAGKRLTGQAAQDVEQTLRAAVADENAAAAVQSGLLLRQLTASGFEPVDVTDAVAVPLPELPEPPPALEPAANAESPGEHEPADGEPAGAAERKAADARARRAAEKALAEAEERAAHSDADVAAAEDRVRDLNARARELTDEEAGLRERLEALAAQLAGLQREKKAAEADRNKAGRTADRASDALERARARLARLD